MTHDPGLAPEKADSMAKQIDLETALRLIDAAKKKAVELKVAMNIAVVDAGNNLVAFQRMDGAWLGSINISMNKAYTARAFDMETKTLAPLCQPGQPLFGIHASNDGRLIIFPGGIPLKDGGKVIGAIGVSGSSVENDQAVAAAGAAAL
jgi:uncharacterized protein GlcG (DUF336 family)